MDDSAHGGLEWRRQEAQGSHRETRAGVCELYRIGEAAANGHLGALGRVAALLATGNAKNDGSHEPEAAEGREKAEHALHMVERMHVTYL